MKSMKLPKLKRGVAGALLVCISAGASVAFAAGPTTQGYLFAYKNVGVRSMAPTYESLAAQAVAGLAGRFNFVAPNGTGTALPYFNDATGTGDVLFVESNWGTLPWAGKAEMFNEFYLGCQDDDSNFIPSNCNSTNKKVHFALIKFNTDAVNDLWSTHIDKTQTINGHTITINDVRQHLIAHEFGHVLGMGHEEISCFGLTDINDTQTTLSTSVMQAGTFCRPLFTGYQSPDITWISGKY